MGPDSLSVRLREPLPHSLSPVQFQDETKSLPRFKHLLACVDFSPASCLALTEAIRVCKAVGAKLTLLHACAYAELSSERTDCIDSETFRRAAAKARLEVLLDEATRQGVRADSMIEAGEPVAVILQVIAKWGFDLAFLGTQGRLGMERMVVGSTAEAVLRNAQCPVFTVGPQAIDHLHTRPSGPVLLATDFHESAADALRYAAVLANKTASPLHCLHVLPLSMQADKQSNVSTQVVTNALHHLVEGCMVCLQPPTCAIAYGSEVSHAIVDYAKAQRAELIVLSVRRAPAVVAHLPPDATYRIIVTAPCPVLTLSHHHSWVPQLEQTYV